MIKSVKIGPQTFNVIERDPDEDGMLNDGAYGYTIDGKNLIVIAAGLNRSKQQVTLLHEILHAVRMSNDGMPRPSKDDDFESWEHYFIAMYETGLLAVLKDNPKLREWLVNDQTTNK
jgi:Mlc titration factor MtfA (ptsG expression regulator)